MLIIDLIMTPTNNQPGEPRASLLVEQYEKADFCNFRDFAPLLIVVLPKFIIGLIEKNCSLSMAYFHFFIIV